MLHRPEFRQGTIPVTTGVHLPRLLLTAGTAPGPEGVGGIFLEDLCRLFAPGQLAGFFSLRDAAAYRPPPDLAERMPMQTLTMLPTALPRAPGGILGKALAWMRHERRFRSRLQALLAQATAFGLAHRPDKLWAVLDAPEPIALAAPLARALGVPLCTLVWDDAAQIASHFQLDRFSAKRLHRDFAAAIQASERCAVISEPMAQAYAQRYAARCVVLRHGLPLAAPLHKPARAAGDDAFRIALVGTMSAPCAFGALVRALDSVDWRIAGRPVELWVTGPRLDIRSMRPAAVRYFGWRDTVEETLQLLAGVDAAYMPQPFDEHSRELARLSFPAKLTTYLAAGLPILLHAPAHASLAEYHRQHPLGEWCGSLQAPAIVAAIGALAGDPARCARASADARAAWQRDFTAERFAQSFARFVGAGPAAPAHAAAAP